MMSESAEGEHERKLRPKVKKTYLDDGIDEDDIEGKRTFNVEEKLLSNAYGAKFVEEMNGSDLTLALFQMMSLRNPIVIKEKAGLGLRVPSENFKVSDVKQCVGSRRVLDVMDVTTQKALEMTMKEWVLYYEQENKDRLLNVISLEFSHTKLENYVEQPKLVNQIDWVNTVWPQHWRDCQTESTNLLDRMKYPKVQKYCLMSVKGCYTDFHIDMGGTSVWYHILHGSKIFWLIPPTDKNLQLYETWVMSGKQGDFFFGDQVEDCQRIHLQKGWTFLIPTGWIHAVYTPEDSLVFGGNYLHSFNMEMQLRVAQVEEKTKVPQQFRYPFFWEIHWYLLARYVSVLCKKSHVDFGKEDLKEENVEGKEETDEVKDEQCDAKKEIDEQKTTGVEKLSIVDEKKDVSLLKNEIVNEVASPKLQGVKEEEPVVEKKPAWFHLTPMELSGLRLVIEKLESFPAHKNYAPLEVKNSKALLEDAKELLELHKNDSAQLSATGTPILKPLPRRAKKKIMTSSGVGGSGSGSNSARALHLSKLKKAGITPSNVRRRRVRCKRCEACTRTDCGECTFCKDMRKFGGPGKMKQTCKSRQCMQPMLPNLSVCAICGKTELKNERNIGLMECGICWEIVHPTCLKVTDEQAIEGSVNEDLPNSWECPKCCGGGLQGQSRARIPSKTISEKSPLKSLDMSSDSPPKKIFLVQDENEVQEISETEEWQMTSEEDIEVDEHEANKVEASFVVRPAPMEIPSQSMTFGNPLRKITFQSTVRVFSYLNLQDLRSCMLVCKLWNRWAITPQLWTSIDLSCRILTKRMMIGVVRRQPRKLNLAYTYISQQQLRWLLPRLPQLKALNLAGNDWPSLDILYSTGCPLLRDLNLQWVGGVVSDSIKLLVSPPIDNRPALDCSQSRTRRLESLDLSGTDISDECLPLISENLSRLKTLNLSYCNNISEEGLKQLPASITVLKLDTKSS